MLRAPPIRGDFLPSTVISWSEHHLPCSVSEYVSDVGESTRTFNGLETPFTKTILSQWQDPNPMGKDPVTTGPPQVTRVRHEHHFKRCWWFALSPALGRNPTGANVPRVSTVLAQPDVPVHIKRIADVSANRQLGATNEMIAGLKILAEVTTSSSTVPACRRRCSAT